MKILLLMILCHIIDDFVFQPQVLSQLKQKSWWEEHAPQEMYAFDYITALFIHALSWSIMICLPVMFVKVLSDTLLFITIITNTLIHYFVDDLKANKHKINLTRDQLIHLVQILTTWTLLYLL